MKAREEGRGESAREESGQQRNSLTKAHLATLTESIDLDWIRTTRPFVGQTRIRLKEEEEEKKFEAAALPNKRLKKKRSIHF